jgi:hypothetical protein
MKSLSKRPEIIFGQLLLMIPAMLFQNTEFFVWEVSQHQLSKLQKVTKHEGIRLESVHDFLLQEFI